MTFGAAMVAVMIYALQESKPFYLQPVFPHGYNDNDLYLSSDFNLSPLEDVWTVDGDLTLMGTRYKAQPVYNYDLVTVWRPLADGSAEYLAVQAGNVVTVNESRVIDSPFDNPAFLFRIVPASS